MPLSEEQMIERLSKKNQKVRDCVNELEELLKKDVGGLLDKLLIVTFRKSLTKMEPQTCLSQAENSIEILEECVLLIKYEKQRREFEEDLKRIRSKGETKEQES